jgi:hypothetical protein
VLSVTTLFVVCSISMEMPLVAVLTATTLTVWLVCLQLRLIGSRLIHRVPRRRKIFANYEGLLFSPRFWGFGVGALMYNKTMKKKNPTHKGIENKPYIEAMRELRRSNAATTHDNRPNRLRTRQSVKNQAIKENE